MFNFLKMLFSNKGKRGKPAPEGKRSSTVAYTISNGNIAPVGEAFHASHSNDLKRMLNALSLKASYIDRHFLLMGIVSESYKNRNNEKMLELCLKTSVTHLKEFPRIMSELKKEFGKVPQVDTFKLYATILAEQGDFEKAIEVCKSAIAYGIEDGTKSGFEGRIERIKKRMGQYQNPRGL